MMSASLNKLFDYTQKKTQTKMNEWMFNNTPARKTDQLLGVKTR